jgi:hypothetical protein
MGDSLVISRESRGSWADLLGAAATPARWPPFPGLDDEGQWSEWNACPVLPNNASPMVKQPVWTRSPPCSINSSKLFPRREHTQLQAGYIRLVSLENARMDVGTNTLRDFGIINVPLQSAPEYEALSYCWKDTRICTGIFFNHDGHETIFRLTEDLAAFLYSIIKTDDLKTPNYLWIDQICIDQENINERNAQVACMADIYRRASRVIVWLGQRSDEDYVQQHVADVQSASNTDADSNTLQDVAALVQTIQSASILSRSWFSRLWVFQEVVLAKSIVILVGEQSYRWEEIKNISDTIIKAWFHVSRGFLWTECNTYMVDAVDTARKEMASSGSIDIMHWLPQLADNQRCQDARDYIFGLIGCIGYDFPFDLVDYRRSNHEVFRDANRFLIDSSKSLQVIIHVNGKNGQRHHPIVPSWSPHWGENRTVLNQDRKEKGACSASHGRAHTPTIAKHPNKLDVQGKVMGTVRAVTDSSPQLLVAARLLKTTPRDLCNTIWPYVRRRYQTDNGMETLINNTLHDNGSNPPTSQTEVQREPVIDTTLPFDFIRDIIDTLCCHTDPSTPPLKLQDRSLEETYRLMFDGPFGEELEREPLDIRHQALVCQAVSFDRAIAVLEDGRLALVWGDMVEVGDKIAILHGLDLPCLLHKAEGEGEWTVQGDAFVKNLMYGGGVTWEEDEADTFTLI